MRRRTVLGLLVTASFPAGADDLVSRLRTEPLTIVMRHARTVAGTGDPPGFRLGDCSTQRNLDAGGRAQARATGDAWRELGLPVTELWSSAWCRCIETGELLRFGPVGTMPTLNSFFDERGRREAQTDELRRWLRQRRGGGIAVLVTHQVNITALSGVSPRSGEAMVMDADAEPLGRLGPYG